MFRLKTSAAMAAATTLVLAGGMTPGDFAPIERTPASFMPMPSQRPAQAAGSPNLSFQQQACPNCRTLNFSGTRTLSGVGRGNLINVSSVLNKGLLGPNAHARRQVPQGFGYRAYRGATGMATSPLMFSNWQQEAQPLAAGRVAGGSAQDSGLPPAPTFETPFWNSERGFIPEKAPWYQRSLAILTADLPQI